MKKVFTHMLVPEKSVGFLSRFGGMCLFQFISFLVYAQEQAVSGTRKDESGQSSPGSGSWQETLPMMLLLRMKNILPTLL